MIFVTSVYIDAFWMQRALLGKSSTVFVNKQNSFMNCVSPPPTPSQCGWESVVCCSSLWWMSSANSEITVGRCKVRKSMRQSPQETNKAPHTVVFIIQAYMLFSCPKSPNRPKQHAATETIFRSKFWNHQLCDFKRRLSWRATGTESSMWEHQPLEEHVCLPSEPAVTHRRQTEVLHDL